MPAIYLLFESIINCEKYRSYANTNETRDGHMRITFLALSLGAGKEMVFALCLQAATLKQPLVVASFGGGPGSDLFGFLGYLDRGSRWLVLVCPWMSSPFGLFANNSPIIAAKGRTYGP